MTWNASQRASGREAAGWLHVRRSARIAVTWLAVMLVSVLTVAAFADSPQEIKTRLDREQDPVKRGLLQMKLAEYAFDESHRLYDDGSDQALPKLKEMLDYIQQAEQTLFNTGRDPRKKPKGFKESEIKLRELQRRLTDLATNLPLDERPPVQEIGRQVAQIHDRFLNGIMEVKERKK